MINEGGGPRTSGNIRGSPGRTNDRLRGSILTVRFRITALATIAVFVVLGVASAGLVFAQRQTLTQGLDEGVSQHVDEIAALVIEGRVPALLSGLGDDDTVAQVVRADGLVVATSANAADLTAIADMPPAGSGTHISTVQLRSDAESSYRLVSRRVEGLDGPAAIHMAAILDEVDESARVVASSLSVVVPSAAVILGALVWWLVGRTLRPVEAIRAEVAGIGADDLRRRVPQPRGNDEIARLARTMNAMLDRVDSAARRQQAFVADASHELRSPLTRIRSEIEVDLAHPAQADLAATHRSVLEETAALENLVDDLLHLARSDATAGPLRRTPLDFDDVVLTEARRLRPGRRVTVDVSGVTAAQVHGDAAQLARVVRNLVDNAARHATETVTITLAERADGAQLAVSDDGPGIPLDQHARVFERFARVDDARDRVRGGTGLGLAICRDIVHRHGGTIEIDPGHRPGARFVVILPLGAS